MVPCQRAALHRQRDTLNANRDEKRIGSGFCQTAPALAHQSQRDAGPKKTCPACESPPTDRNLGQGLSPSAGAYSAAAARSAADKSKYRCTSGERFGFPSVTNAVRDASSGVAFGTRPIITVEWLCPSAAGQPPRRYGSAIPRRRFVSPRWHRPRVSTCALPQPLR